MQTIPKKKRAASGRARLLLLPAAALVLAVAVAITSLLHNEPALPQAPASTAQTLHAHAAGEVASITITPHGEAPFTLTQTAPGLLTLQGAEGFTLSETTSARLLDAARIIDCEEVLSLDPAEYTTHLADFGLAEPDVASITYTDGSTVTLRVGSRASHTTAWYYMTIDGDERLFGLGVGAMEALFVSQESLRDVTQPILHKARMDRITLRSGDGSIRAQWTLQGDITDDDALDRWQVTEPFVYPADASAMESLLSNAANLRLGAYVAPATPENLAQYGFDAPRLTIELHMAPGVIGITDAEGAFTTQEWPDSSCIFTIGGARSELVDYVLHDGSIYVSSHFTMGVFLEINPRSSMTRYPVLTALGNLAALTIEENGTVTAYALTRTEQVAPNNDLVTDEAGNIVYDVTVTRNGEPCDYAAFQAAYERLITVRTSGLLPEDDPATEAPHTVYTFTDVDGTVHTVALHSYGVLHDAVSVDGHQAFYMEKGSFRLGLE